MAQLTARENKIIHTITVALKQHPGLEINFNPSGAVPPFSGYLTLSGAWGNIERPVFIAWRITPQQAKLLLFQLQTLQHKQPVLMADYVPETLGAKLRQHKINYLDGVGNGSIQDETFFYEISGRKKKTPQVLPNRTQQVAGTKIIYQLLKNPQLCDKPYRTIAQQAQVALGAVGPVIKELHKKNLLADDVDGTRRVAHATALRQLWEAAYLGRLRPKLQLERCELSSPWHTDNLPLLIKEQNLEDQVVVGGEMAASFYCEHSHVRTAVLHLAESTALKQMLQLRLIPCTDGPITIVNQFSLNDAFEQRSAEGLLLADPRLVRCELLYDERLQDVKYTNLASQIEQEYLLGTEQLYEG